MRWQRLFYKTDSLEAARAEQARTAAQLNTIRAEDLRKTRIPIGIVLQVNDGLPGHCSDIKSRKGQTSHCGAYQRDFRQVPIDTGEIEIVKGFQQGKPKHESVESADSAVATVARLTASRAANGKSEANRQHQDSLAQTRDLLANIVAKHIRRG